MEVDDDHSPRLEDDADLPRHQRKRPAMLSMELVDTPSSEPTPVVGSMSDSSSGSWASTTPMGKIRMVSERLGSSVYGKKKKDKDKKKRSSSSPSTARAATASSSSSSLPPSFSSSSHSNVTVVTRLTPTRSSAANSNVRVSSPLSEELGPKSNSSSSSSNGGSGNSNDGDGNGKLTRTLSGSSLKKKHSSPLGEADLQDLALDQSKNGKCDSMQDGNYDANTDDDDDEERKEEACFSPRVGGSSSNSSSSSSRGGGMFRPLSPLVMPMLRSPRMRRVLGEENLDKVASLFEGTCSPTQQQQQSSSSPSSSSPSSTSSPRSGASAISSLAKKMVQASVHAMSSSSSSSSSLTQVVAPKPLRVDAPLVLLPPPPPPSSFAHVQPYIPASVAAAAAAAASSSSSSTQHQIHPRNTSSVSFSVPPPSALQQNFTVALGLCLLACGFSQAGLEWYTMNLGSDYSTWWAGLISALLGLATMAAQKKGRGNSNSTSSSSSSNGSSSVMASLRESATVLLHMSYALLVVSGAAAVVAALFFDLKLLDRLEQTDMCGASTDKLVLDNGLVLSETLGNACGFSSGCACVQFTHPLPAGDVACMNFARSSAVACPNIPFAIAGMVRVSVWLMGGLLFFMTVLMLRARSSVIGACEDRGGGGAVV